MAILVCRRCTTRFAVGLHCCPHCTGESAYLLDDESEAEAIEQEEDMARSNQNGVTHEQDGVTRSVDADGNVGDPIHDVDGDTTESTTDETTQVDTKKAPAKKAAPAKASAK